MEIESVKKCVDTVKGYLRSDEFSSDAGELQLALHVIDLLAVLESGEPEVAEARRLKALWLRQRASEVRSYVSKSLYHGCADLLEQGRHSAFGVS